MKKWYQEVMPYHYVLIVVIRTIIIIVIVIIITENDIKCGQNKICSAQKKGPSGPQWPPLMGPNVFKHCI